MAVTFSNPRILAEFNDWHLGGSKRGTMKFSIEFNQKRGYRFVRQSIDPTTGKPSKPKTETYGGKGAIVDGSDGKTYLIQFAGIYDFITIRRHDFMCADPAIIGGDHAVFPDKDERFPRLALLIKRANCAHNAQVETGDPDHAWKCADCGYVYGKGWDD
jgi:hypothetical protein